MASLQIARAPFKFDRSAPLWVVAPPDERRVNVRWAEGATDAARQDREVQFGLTAGVRADGRTWSYVLTDHGTGNLRALIQDPMVDDTAGIDRGTFQVLPERWESWLKRKLFVLRLSLAPGVFTAQNALAWFYYLTILVPVVALGWVGAAWWYGTRGTTRGRRGRGCGHPVLHHLAHPYPGVAGLASGRCRGTHVRARGVARAPAQTVRGDSHVHARLARAGIVSLFLVTFWSVWSVGGTGMTGGLGMRIANTGIWGRTRRRLGATRGRESTVA